MSTSLTHRGYGIVKEHMSKDDLEHLRKELTVKPYNVMDMGTSAAEKQENEKQFRVYLESDSKIYVPRAYGLRHFGLPEVSKIPKGEKIDIEFAGKLRPDQLAPADAFVKAAKDPLKMGGIINLRCGQGKCLGRDTPVLMYNGSMKMVQDVLVGDLLMGDDSSPRRVLSTCTGKEMLYDIIPDLGTSYVVNESHILSLKCAFDCKYGHQGKVVDMPLLQAVKALAKDDCPLRGYKVPIDFPLKELSMDPYRFGLYHDKSPHIAIPKEYKCNTVSARLATLGGLIDCYGTTLRNGFKVTVGNEELMDDILFIARSLGMSCYKSRSKRLHKYQTYIYGEGLQLVPTRIHLLNCSAITYNAAASRLNKIKIQAKGVGEYYGFEIDGNRRFVLGDFTVTHNTVIGLYIISQLKTKTLIVVHKEFLLDQWKERISQFLPKARVGMIKAQVCDVDNKDIVIGSLQSLCMKDYDRSIFETFGMAIYDEVHRTGAEVFSRVYQKVNVSYSLGLSATVNRKDGLTKVFKWHIGDIVFKGEKAKDNLKVVMKEYYDANHLYSREHTLWNKKPNMTKMITNICDFVPRNAFIVQTICDILLEEPNRKILILSDRRGHLEALKPLVENHGITTGFYYGGLKQEELKESEKQQVLLATFAYSAEGLDIKGLDTLILASPKSDIVQSVGRILRDKPSDRKHVPLVIDITDNFSIFPNQARKRASYYKSQGYDVGHDKLFENVKITFEGVCHIRDDCDDTEGENRSS